MPESTLSVADKEVVAKEGRSDEGHSEPEVRFNDEEHGTEASGKPLREAPLEEIINSTPKVGSIGDDEKSSINSRQGSIGNRETPPTISNPIFAKTSFRDNREQRYEDDEDEDNGTRPYSPSPYDTTNASLTYSPVPNDSRSNGLIAQGDNSTSERRQFDKFRNFNVSSFGKFGFRQQSNDENTNGISPSDEHHPSMMEPDGRNKFRKRLTMFLKSRKQGKFPRKSLGINDSIKSRQEREAGERAQQAIASLSLGTPSINLLASCLLVDEMGIARAPLLLTLLGLSVRDSTPNENSRIRRFIIDLEYGVGPQRLHWSVEKTMKDLLYLHSRLKFLPKWKTEVLINKIPLPKYPIPPIMRGPKDPSNTRTTLNSIVNSHPRTEDDDISSIRSGSSRIFHNLRQQITRSSITSTDHHMTRQQRNAEYIRDVESYLKELIQKVALKPQSNKLFKFFEISPISALLCYETGYTGKQGEIHIGGTAKSRGWRVGHFKAGDIKEMVERRSEKWLLIRNSYVMFVSNINSTIPLDIFLVDSHFKINYNGAVDLTDEDDDDYDDSSIIQRELANVDEIKSSSQVFKHLKIILENGERRLILNPKSKLEQKLWIKSLIDMKNSTVYSNENRFESFAPVRQNCFAQWMVDARDHFWAISCALEMAKDVIFIHDWWLSPELYLRRPANGNQQWRLDRVLQRKAKQGVKIFVIIYRNVGSTVATDSLYTKHSLISLDEENIHVIRSPNQLLQNTFFWAHHEKLCIIDHTIAFLGGIDLCYGRFDTPDHVLTDDSNVNFETVESEPRTATEEFAKFQVFPGKDYSNPRVKDFIELDKPYKDMYDRSEIPRMPWHDIHMVTGGQVARDLARHFVQRWNYLLRQKRPSRYTPLLIPPPDMTEEEVEQLGLNGTCEVQLLRSSGNWSLGLKKHEQSIQNAYLKLIETSEHFVYIENQFFITSCVVDGNVIHNRIGDALVERIIRAHNERTNWKAIIVIPLMPGFEAQVDEADGSSVRVIMQCQYMSISRGSTSIFAKLRKYGIVPEDYIQFYSLRKWSRIGQDRTLVTEQLYVHAKSMIVDDRFAIIGSANINERSMRGIRDSEVAAIVQDKETVLSTMNGEPYQVGKFPHTLRMRLMREHLGVNVDVLDMVERRFRRFQDFAATKEGLKAATSHFKSLEHLKMSAMVEIASRDILGDYEGTDRWHKFQTHHCLSDTVNIPEVDDNEHEDIKVPPPVGLTSFNFRTGPQEANKGIRDKKKHSYDARVQHNESKKKDVFGDGKDKYRSKLAKRARLNSARFLKELASRAMNENPTKAFIPDLESVTEFLEGDDAEMLDEMDEESEKLITQRNTERWLLLKKIAYLQRVAAKEKADNEAEEKKRAEANLSTTNELNSSSTGTPEPNGSADVKISSSSEPSKENTAVSDAVGSTGSEEKKDENAETKYPIVKLNEDEARDLIAEINPRRVEHFSRFVDPYVFEDPLAYSFSEDLWYENAKRNTEIFRTVFHSQPDNLVSSWKDYKEYANLQKAFLVSQQKEAKYRRQKQTFGKSVPEETYDSEDEPDGPHYRPGMYKRHGSISLSKFDQNIGLVGNAPDEANTYDAPIVEEEEENEDSESTSLPDAKCMAERSRIVNNVLNIPTIQPKSNTRRRHGTFSHRMKASMGRTVFERDSAERILKEVQGHLVLFPTEWLLRELEGANWFHSTDRLPPIDIYD
jgi:phospholipase D1/2